MIFLTRCPWMAAPPPPLFFFSRSIPSSNVPTRLSSNYCRDLFSVRRFRLKAEHNQFITKRQRIPPGSGSGLIYVCTCPTRSPSSARPVLVLVFIVDRGYSFYVIIIVAFLARPLVVHPLSPIADTRFISRLPIIPLSSSSTSHGKPTPGTLLLSRVAGRAGSGLKVYIYIYIRLGSQSVDFSPVGQTDELAAKYPNTTTLYSQASHPGT